MWFDCSKQVIYPLVKIILIKGGTEMAEPYGVDFLQPLVEVDEKINFSTQTNTTTIGADPDSDVDDEPMD